MELDNADKKILHSLYQNSRNPLSKIAKLTGLTREIVENRIKKFEENGVVKGYIARINQSYFCQGICTLYLKLIRFDEKRFNEIVAYLKNHSSVNWFAELCGSADLVCTLLYANSEELADIVSGITQFIGNNLKEHHISLYITEYKFNRQGLIFEKEEQYSKSRVVNFNSERKDRIELDNKDIIILKELAKNCRIKNKLLAEKSSLSEDGVRLRIKRLEKNNLITGYTIVLDTNKIGYESYYMGLQVENMTKENISKISYYAHTNPNIVYCTRTAGKYNIVMTLSVRNRQQFSKLLLEIRKQFGDFLVDYEFQLYLNEHKEIFVPEGFLKLK